MSRAASGEEPDLPHGYFGSEPTDFLVKTRERKSQAESYELQRELVRRASEFGEYAFLLALLNSRNFSRKAFGSFLVGEIVDKTGLVWPAIRKTLTSWSEELIQGFRYRFVDFVTNSKYYDDQIAKGMKKCLEDDSAFVRQNAIYWLCSVNPNSYVDFYEMVFAYELKKNTKFQNNYRLTRAINISNKVRSGRSIDFVVNKVKFEEYETFEYLCGVESRLFKIMSRWQDLPEGYSSILEAEMPTV